MGCGSYRASGYETNARYLSYVHDIHATWDGRDDERSTYANLGPERATGSRRTEEHEQYPMRDGHTREDHTSRHAPARRSVNHRYAGPDQDEVPRRADGRDGDHRLPFPRLMSAFVPLPNTRVAEYVGTHGPSQSRIPSEMPPPPPDALNGMLHSPAMRSRRRQTMSARSPARMDLEGERLQSPTERGLPRSPEWRRQEYEPSEEDWDGLLDQEVFEEDGEVLPSVLRQRGAEEDEAPTAPPEGGFPAIHRDDPEALIRGMSDDWVREIWSDPPNTGVAVDVFNYRFTEDDAHNRQVADALHWAFQQITGERDFDVVPPEPDTARRLRARDTPTTWMVRGLSTRGTARALSRRTWSFKCISFFTAPRSTPIPTWLFTLEGFLRGDARKIRAAILRALGDREMAGWIMEMVESNPDFAGIPLEDAVESIHHSVRVEVLQLGNGNYIANTFIRPPTRDPRIWRQWVADLRSRRYPSFAIGTGRVRYIAQCIGCHGVSHPVHLCPYARIRGWNGPRPGEGVFGERAGRSTPQTAPRSYGSNTSAETRRRPGQGNDERNRGPQRDESRDPRSPRGRWHDDDPRHDSRSRRPRGGGDRNQYKKRENRRN